jgi:hypothetical protein
MVCNHFGEIIMRRFPSTLIAAAVCGLFGASVQAATPQCSQLTTSEFNKFNGFIADFKTALNVANAGVGAIPFVMDSYMNGLEVAWQAARKPWDYEGSPASYRAIDLVVNPIPDALHGSYAPAGAVQFGYELNWRISHLRYWTSIGVFYNRAALSAASSMNANGYTTAKLFENAYDKIEKLHAQAERINTLSVKCMASLS